MVLDPSLLKLRRKYSRIAKKAPRRHKHQYVYTTQTLNVTTSNTLVFNPHNFTGQLGTNLSYLGNLEEGKKENYQASYISITSQNAFKLKTKKQKRISRKHKKQYVYATQTLYLNAANTLVFSETVTSDQVTNQSFLGHKVKKPKRISRKRKHYTYATQTLYLNAANTLVFNETVTSIIVTSQSFLGHKAKKPKKISRKRKHYIYATQTLALNVANTLVFNETVTSIIAVQLPLVIKHKKQSKPIIRKRKYVYATQTLNVTASNILAFYERVITPYVDEHLIFSQTIIFIKITNATFNNTLVFNQVISLQKTLSLSAANILVFTEKVIIPYAENHLIFTQSAIGNKVSTRLTFNTLVFYSNVMLLGERVASTIHFTGGLSGSSNVYNRSVSNTLIFNENITYNIIRSEHINNVIGFYNQYLETKSTPVITVHIFTGELGTDLSYLSNIEPGIIAVTPVVANFTGELGTDLSYLSNIEPGIISAVTASTPSITETEIVQRLSFDSRVADNYTLAETVSNVLNIHETIAGRHIIIETFAQSLTFINDVQKDAIPSSGHNTLVFTEIIIESKVISLTAVNTLNLIGLGISASILNYHLNQNLAIVNGQNRTIRINVNNPTPSGINNPVSTPTIISIPAVIGIVLPNGFNVVVIEVSNAAITLPAPVFNDGQALSSIVKVMKSVLGDTYTYVRENEIQHLKYVFGIGRLKSLELYDFLYNHNTELMKMTNWKGEIWYVTLGSFQPDLVARSRFSLEREYIDCLVEFDGVQITG